MNENQDICCPKFEVSKWNNKTFDWNEKPFIKASVPTFFHIPLTSMISKRMSRLHNAAKDAHADIQDLSEALILFHDPSAFKSEFFYAVTKPVEGVENATLSGKFVAGVFDGPYNSVPKHIKTMNKKLQEQGRKVKDYYIHYAYCPKCAKKFGNNYMILFAETE